jgi:hypothetical protein
VKIGYDYDRVRKEADGKDYLVPKSTELAFEAQGMSIRLENLFNGDKFLGKCSYHCPTQKDTRPQVQARVLVPYSLVVYRCFGKT